MSLSKPAISSLPSEKQIKQIVEYFNQSSDTTSDKLAAARNNVIVLRLRQHIGEVHKTITAIKVSRDRADETPDRLQQLVEAIRANMDDLDITGTFRPLDSDKEVMTDALRAIWHGNPQHWAIAGGPITYDNERGFRWMNYYMTSYCKKTPTSQYWIDESTAFFAARSLITKWEVSLYMRDTLLVERFGQPGDMSPDQLRAQLKRLDSAAAKSNQPLDIMKRLCTILLDEQKTMTRNDIEAHVHEWYTWTEQFVIKCIPGAPELLQGIIEHGWIRPESQCCHDDLYCTCGAREQSDTESALTQTDTPNSSADKISEEYVNTAFSATELPPLTANEMDEAKIRIRPDWDDRVKAHVGALLWKFRWRKIEQDDLTEEVTKIVHLLAESIVQQPEAESSRGPQDQVDDTKSLEEFEELDDPLQQIQRRLERNTEELARLRAEKDSIFELKAYYTQRGTPITAAEQKALNDRESEIYARFAAAEKELRQNKTDLTEGAKCPGESTACDTLPREDCVPRQEPTEDSVPCKDLTEDELRAFQADLDKSKADSKTSAQKNKSKKKQNKTKLKPKLKPQRQDKGSAEASEPTSASESDKVIEEDLKEHKASVVSTVNKAHSLVPETEKFHEKSEWTEVVGSKVAKAAKPVKDVNQVDKPTQPVGLGISSTPPVKKSLIIKLTVPADKIAAPQQQAEPATETKKRIDKVVQSMKTSKPQKASHTKAWRGKNRKQPLVRTDAESLEKATKEAVPIVEQPVLVTDPVVEDSKQPEIIVETVGQVVEDVQPVVINLPKGDTTDTTADSFIGSVEPETKQIVQPAEIMQPVSADMTASKVRVADSAIKSEDCVTQQVNKMTESTELKGWSSQSDAESEFDGRMDTVEHWVDEVDNAGPGAVVEDYRSDCETVETVEARDAFVKATDSIVVPGVDRDYGRREAVSEPQYIDFRVCEDTVDDTITAEELAQVDKEPDFRPHTLDFNLRRPNAGLAINGLWYNATGVMVWDANETAAHTFAVTFTASQREVPPNFPPIDYQSLFLHHPTPQDRPVHL